MGCLQKQFWEAYSNKHLILEKKNVLKSILQPSPQEVRKRTNKIQSRQKGIKNIKVEVYET
jgi:hypothetical protein